jgi:hypothetical protein
MALTDTACKQAKPTGKTSSCTTDVSCSVACVNGLCYSAPGTCEIVNT